MSLGEAIKSQQKYQLFRLLDIFEGNQSAMAKRLCVSRQAVNNWFARGRISKRGAKKAEIITKGAIKKQDLRPDVLEWL